MSDNSPFNLSRRDALKTAAAATIGAALPASCETGRRLKRGKQSAR